MDRLDRIERDAEAVDRGRGSVSTEDVLLLARVAREAVVIRGHETHPPRSENQAAEEWERFCEAVDALSQEREEYAAENGNQTP